MGSDEFTQAHHSVIDPLVELEPSEETGLNTHFRSTFAPRQTSTPPNSAGLKNTASADIRPQHTGSTTDTNPFRRSRASSATVAPSNNGDITPTRRHDYPSPPNSASPRREHFSNHRATAFGSLNEPRPRRSSQPSSNNPFQKETGSGSGSGKGLQRGGSLRERYPGDNSNRPLDIIRKDTKTAHRAHHLRKKNFQGADPIDRLDRTDVTGFSYHHEGPYDAANLSRNTDFKHSPVAAVRESNEEALKATPRELVIDAITKHRPLEGVATTPPGVPDRFGRVLDYEEGTDLMREPGADYKRWPGVTYLPGDLKGKGEPSFSIEKSIKDHKRYGDEGIEMTSRPRNQSLGNADAPERSPLQSSFEDAGVGRSNTTGKSMGTKLKSRFGSLRHRKTPAQA